MIGLVQLDEVAEGVVQERLASGAFDVVGLEDLHVAAFEIGCGLLILVGLGTRLAAVPLIIDMLVALASTKIPMLSKSGFWSTAHEARVDWSMLLGAIFLLIVGGGTWSLDAWLARREPGRD